MLAGISPRHRRFGKKNGALAAIVALLSSKRLTVASGGAEAVSACSSIAPRVAPMVLPLRSAAPAARSRNRR